MTKLSLFLDNTSLLSEDGKWLQRPELCQKLEDHYEITMDNITMNLMLTAIAFLMKETVKLRLNCLFIK